MRQKKKQQQRSFKKNRIFMQT